MKLVLKLKIFVIIIVLKISWFLSYYFEKNCFNKKIFILIVLNI